MSLFGKTSPSDPAPAAWESEMKEIEERWNAFLEKLETRMDELCEAAIPELEEAFRTDADPYHRTYERMASAIRGQLGQMQDKVRETQEEKVEGFFQRHVDRADAGSTSWTKLYAFRKHCYDKADRFEEKNRHWIDAIGKTAKRDLEAEYRTIVEEYERIRDSFACKQCGSSIPIEKMYFIPVYLTCRHCQTQNTFEPSSRARGLEFLGRELAEERTKHLLSAYEKARENDGRTSGRETSALDISALYETYLRAMFDEWNKIVPDLAEQNEKFHNRMLEDFRKHGR